MNLSRIYTLLFYVVSLWGLTAGSAHADIAFSEYKIKAVYIYRLTNFIRWDNASEAAPIFCTLGQDSTTAILTQLLAKNGNIKPVQQMDNLADADKQCDLLYITEKELHALHTLPQYPGLLTISDSADTLPLGGMIELRTLGQQIKPVLSLLNIEKNNLSVSSQLLRIAIIFPPQDKVFQS
ncbi:YfiR family protein [Photobacterium japonica]|uniref:YfiR family protein n=1 Tax=Photobacterium japonica TaxID=2910235 RepID=UPI003D0BF4F6